MKKICRKVLAWIRNNPEKVALLFVLTAIIALNFRPGYFILGNDNYSPEENPLLSFKRYLFSPAWRSYRGLGVPSDAEQVDIFRSFFFLLANKFGMPLWLISQGTIWLVFFLGVWSTAALGEWLLEKILGGKLPGAFFFSGLFYFTNMLTIFLFFSPLKPFVFVWGFLPFFLWRSLVFILRTSLKNFGIFVLSVISLTLAAIIPTIFLAALGVSLFYFLGLAWLGLNKKKLSFVALFFFIFQFFWLFPFVFYVSSNAKSLQQSYINRMITPNTILIEEKYNTIKNVFRYYTSWLDSRNDNGSLVFPYGLVYQTNKLLLLISYLPLFFALLGSFCLLIKKRWQGLFLFFLFLAGGFFIKGSNEPLGSFYYFFQANVPLFRQVFRWGSSKFWPLLALSLPFLAALGVGLSLEKAKWQRLKYLLIFVIGGLQLAFVFPFFKGELVNRREFVKIPRPYFALRQFLAEEGLTQKRLYVAPESNMLYFRHYRWGFYGSVFLNYFLPNPLIEKALITGSPENEDVFFNIVNAYYSENPEFFARALALAKIDLVLADKSATGKGNGYRYNWQVHRQVVENNPWLKKIWQDSFLSLYRLTYRLPKGETRFAYQGHCWRWWQKKEILAPSGASMVSSLSRPGAIFPLFLEPQGIALTSHGLEYSHFYQGPGGNFSLVFPPDLMGKLPTEARLNGGRVYLSPALPQVLVNGKRVVPGMKPFLSFALPRGLKFISLNGSVWPLEQSDTIVFLDPVKKSSSITLWQNKPKRIASPSRIKIKKDSIVEFDLQLKAKKPGWYNFCLESKDRHRCLNKNVSFWATPKAPRVTILIPFVVRAPDELVFWRPENDPQFEVKEVRLYQVGRNIKATNSQLGITPPPFFGEVNLEPKDEIKVVIPRLASADSYWWQREQCLAGIPEIFSSGGVKMRKGRVSVEALSGPAGFYFKFFPLHQSNKLMLFAAGADNLSGIPLDFHFRDSKQEYQIWQERMAEGDKGQLLDFFITPKELHNYILEAYLYSQGKRPSVNLVDYLFFQPLPPAWLELKLEPLQQKGSLAIRGNNQAFHQYWRVSRGEEVRLNGWEQGAIIKENSPVKFSFWPNWLSWIGLGLDFMLVGGGIFWLWRKQRKASPARH